MLSDWELAKVASSMVATQPVRTVRHEFATSFLNHSSHARLFVGNMAIHVGSPATYAGKAARALRRLGVVLARPKLVHTQVSSALIKRS